jgi:hypothetical protein
VVVVPGSCRREVGADQKVLPGRLRAEVRRRVGGEPQRVGGDVGGELAVAEPPRGDVVGEVPAVGREVGLDDGVEVVVVPDVHRRVAERHHRRHQRLRPAAAGPQHEEQRRGQQAPRVHRRRRSHLELDLTSVLRDSNHVFGVMEPLWPVSFIQVCASTNRHTQAHTLLVISEVINGVCYESTTTGM